MGCRVLGAMQGQHAVAGRAKGRVRGKAALRLAERIAGRMRDIGADFAHAVRRLLRGDAGKQRAGHGALRLRPCRAQRGNEICL